MELEIASAGSYFGRNFFIGAYITTCHPKVKWVHLNMSRIERYNLIKTRSSLSLRNFALKFWQSPMAGHVTSN